MTTIARRIIATPVRSASETWAVIVNLLAAQAESPARQELQAVRGIASSLITDEAMKSSPIVVSGSGPRIRIYCLYDEDAMIGDNAKEDTLAFDATAGDWQMSLPCPADDLIWVQASLAKHSTRITARDMTTAVDAEENQSTTTKAIQVNMEAFLRP